MTLVRIEARDGIVFTVNRSTVESIRLIDEMIECCGLSGDDNETIPLRKIDPNILEPILKWAEYYQNEEPSEASSRSFNRRFLAEHEEILFELINISNFLGCESLFELLCKHMAAKISGKSVDEVRNEYNVRDPLPNLRR